MLGAADSVKGLAARLRIHLEPHPHRPRLQMLLKELLLASLQRASGTGSDSPRSVRRPVPCQ